MTPSIVPGDELAASSPPPPPSLHLQGPQAVPLRPLGTSPTTPIPPQRITGAEPDALLDDLNSPHLPREADPNWSSATAHGTAPGSTSSTETADDESPQPSRGARPAELMTSKETPFLRSSPEYGNSYGAIANSPPDGNGHLDDGAAAPSGESSQQPPGVSSGVITKRRSQDASSSRTSGGRRSARRSEELIGSTAVAGLDGRLVTETSILPDLLDDVKSVDEEDENGGLLGGDATNAEDDEDPPDNSPYAQVRASVASTDNTTLSINTPRMWALSVLFSILGSATNLFFSLRYPSVAITPVIALLLVHPLGLMWDFLLKRRSDPPEEFVDGHRVGKHAEWDTSGGSEDHVVTPYHQRSRIDRIRLWLAQGHWNEKEHSCVYVSSNVSFGFAFATDVIVEQTQFYKQEAPIMYQILLILSTQILGYAFAGLTRRFLVRPSGMIWPGTLMSAAMFTTLHKEENKVANGWKITRWNFFYIVWASSFLFYFLPGLLMPTLSYFNVVTWFAPDNVVVANLFGVVSGLGMLPLTFDWAQIAYIGSPLLTPFWAAMNVIGGMFVIMWIVAPIAYYSNWLYTSYMPILSASVFDNTGNMYDVSRILTKDFVFDRAAYSNYSRVFLPVTYVLSYAAQFAGLASLLTHTICWHGQDIWTQWKKSLEEAREDSKPAYQPVPNGGSPIGHEPRRHQSMSSTSMDNLMGREDVHNRLMRRYKDAPMTWYLMTFISMLAIGIFVVEYYPIHLPWYGLLLALGICTVLFIPIGIIMAVTNQHSSIYLICQLICGVVFPGRPVANMVFVTYGYISSAQGIKFAADLKLGHYMKIPPRIMFTVQMVATIVSSLTQIFVLNWMFRNVPGICTSEAINGFICPLARVHFNGSILWGVVGPSEFFGPNATYRSLVWAFLIGAVLPIPLWLYSRHRKDSIIRKINLPLLMGSLSWLPPATGLNFSIWAVVCYVFNYLIKNRAQAWWAKYTMTLSAALDSGLAFGIVIVFFGFIYPGWMDGFSWWGTEVYKQGCDWQACSYNTVPPGTHFGPDTW